MARIFVVGASGWLGRRVFAELAGRPDLELACPGRGPGSALRLDLNEPATHALLDGADVVVNCADPVAAPPLAAARRCLERGPVWIETTAHPPTIDRLCRLPPGGAAGAVIVGAGLFPGVSSLLAARSRGPVELVIELDLLGGAGRGTLASLIPILSDPALQSSRVVVVGARRRGLCFRSAESIIAERFGEPAISTHLVLVHRCLDWSLPLVAAAARRPLLGRAIAAVAGAAMRLIRARFLRRRAGHVALHVAPDAAAFATADGLAATARAVAWAVGRVVAQSPRGLLPITALGPPPLAAPATGFEPPSRQDRQDSAKHPGGAPATSSSW